MKKLFFILLIPVCLGSCKTTGIDILKTAQLYVEEHCDKTVITDSSGFTKAHFECGNLWKVPALERECAEVTLCIDFSKGNVWSDVACATPQISVPYLTKKSKAKK